MGKWKLSSVGRKAPPFLWGQKKEQRSDGDIWLSLTTSSSTSPGLGHPAQVTQAGSLGSARSWLQRGWAGTAIHLVVPRPMAPPNEHPKTTRGRGRGRSFALRITLSIQFNWVVSVMTFQTLNRASFLQSAVLLKKKKSGSKAKEETRVWKERKRQEQWRLSRLGGFPEVSQCQGQVKATHYCLWVSLCSAKFALGIVSLPTLGFSLQSLVFLKTRW